MIKKNRWKNEAVINRKQFYKELSLKAEKYTVGSERDDAIRELLMKYEGYSCSRENINKVFSAYADCFIKKDKMVKAFHKPKLLKMLEKHKVDKRVIKKILSN